jgi:hypothetical protein
LPSLPSSPPAHRPEVGEVHCLIHALLPQLPQPGAVLAVIPALNNKMQEVVSDWIDVELINIASSAAQTIGSGWALPEKSLRLPRFPADQAESFPRGRRLLGSSHPSTVIQRCVTTMLVLLQCAAFSGINPMRERIQASQSLRSWVSVGSADRASKTPKTRRLGVNATMMPSRNH